MGKYTEDAKSALADISEAGLSLPISRATKTVSGATGGVTVGTPTTGALAACVFPATKSSLAQADLKLEDGLTLAKVRKVLAAALGAPFEPSPGDIVDFDGSKWRVLGGTDLAPDGERILYTFFIARQ